MAQSVHDDSAPLRNHSYPERERRTGIKLALDVWYEAWDRTGGEEAGAAKLGDVVGVAGAATVREGTRTNHGARHGTETVEGTGPPPRPGL